MSYYYGQQQQTVPTNSAMAAPSPSNLDISCIVDPAAAGRGGIYVGNITAANNNELLTGTQVSS